MPVRALIGFGLALNAIALWTMSRVSTDSHWTVLLPGFVIGGIGIGFVNAPLASTAVSTVRQERAGMASGINNTFRQIGIATGIAALGAIFASKVDPRAYAPHASEAARASFVHGLHDILLVGAGTAAVGAVLAVGADPAARLRRQRPAARELSDGVGEAANRVDDRLQVLDPREAVVRALELEHLVPELSGDGAVPRAVRGAADEERRRRPPPQALGTLRDADERRQPDARQ